MRTHDNNLYKGILFMMFSAICACFGQLLWKLSDSYIYIILGFLFYGIGAIIMIISYRYGEVSVLQPIQSINYIISIILGNIIFNEDITINKILGLILILIGIITITGVHHD